MNNYVLSIILTIISLTLILILLWIIISEEASFYKKGLSLGKREKEINSNILSKENFNPLPKKYEFYKRDKLVLVQYSNKSLYQNDEKIKDSDIEVTYFYQEKPKSKVKQGIYLTINIILSILLLGMVTFSIYLQVNNNILVVNGSSYVTIRSGSMATKNEDNTYLEENNLDDQLPLFTFIKLDVIDEANKDNLELYDICAYRNEQSNLIVHRIIDIREVNGTTYYEFRGDANSDSDYFLVSSDDVLYTYSGYSNLPLGYVVSFVSSIIGCITILYIFISFLLLDYYDSKKEKYLKEYTLSRINEMNEIKDYSIENGYRVIKIYQD